MTQTSALWVLSSISRALSTLSLGPETVNTTTSPPSGGTSILVSVSSLTCQLQHHKLHSRKSFISTSITSVHCSLLFRAFYSLTSMYSTSNPSQCGEGLFNSFCGPQKLPVHCQASVLHDGPVCFTAFTGIHSAYPSKDIHD